MPAATQTPHEQDMLVVVNILDEDFTVQWGGQPFTIKKGEEKVYHRFIADHMAKHMADRHLLLEEEKRRKATGDPTKPLNYSLLNNKQMRTEAVTKILPRVFQYYLESGQQTPDQKLASEVDQANQEFEKSAKSVGDVPASKALGVLDDKPVPPPPTNTPLGDESAVNLDGKNNKPKPTKKQLLEDCEKLGIETTGKETYEELVEKIKAF